MWAMPYAYLGPEGTFSEAALRAVDPGAEPLSCPTIQAALAAVRDRRGRAGRGPDRVRRSRASSPRPSTTWPPGTAWSSGRNCRSPSRSRCWPGRAPRSATSSRRRPPAVQAAVPRLARRQPSRTASGCRWRPTPRPPGRPRDGQLDAALAGAFAADRYGLAVLAPDVHDRSNAVTRFVEVSPPGSLPARPAPTAPRWPRSWPRTTRARCCEILTEFAVRGINLSTIQSRPTGDGLGSTTSSSTARATSTTPGWARR